MSDGPMSLVLAAGALFAAFASSRAYRRNALRLRRAAVRRGIVSLPPGRALRAERPTALGDLSWLALAAAIWVAASPWTFDYHAAEGAVVSDVVSSASIALLALAAAVFPSLWALAALVGTWLVVAPWIVGYGDANGPVGISDSVAGVLVVVASLSGMAAASRSLRAGGGGAGRVRGRDAGR